MRAVAHPIRLAIIDLLDEEQQLNVNRIYAQLGMEQSITSQHLKVLRDTDVVITKREGKMIFYTLSIIIALIVCVVKCYFHFK